MLGDRLITVQQLHGTEGVSASFETLVANLRRIRTQGHAMSVGELDPGLAGIAVPLPRPGDEGTAALGVILSKRRFANTDVEAMVRRLQRAADDVVRDLAERPAG